MLLILWRGQYNGELDLGHFHGDLYSSYFSWCLAHGQNCELLIWILKEK